MTVEALELAEWEAEEQEVIDVEAQEVAGAPQEMSLE